MDEKARSRLEALQELQATDCFCSSCGKKLRYRSFRTHPCFVEAVERYGRYRARMIVYRRRTRPGTTSLAIAPRPALPTPTLEAASPPSLSLLISRPSSNSLHYCGEEMLIVLNCSSLDEASLPKSPSPSSSPSLTPSSSRRGWCGRVRRPRRRFRALIHRACAAAHTKALAQLLSKPLIQKEGKKECDCVARRKSWWRGRARRCCGSFPLWSCSWRCRWCQRRA
jgi:hypothetical protein